MRRFGVLILMIAIPLLSLAQREIEEDAPPKFKDRAYFGGGFGLGGGTGYFTIALNPVIGYMLTPKMSAGMGINWYMTKYTDITPNVTIQQYGVSPFLRYNINQMFLYGEYNILSTNYTYTDSRQWVSRLLLGVGYSQPLGKSGAMHAMGLYDVLYKNNGTFASPWVIRVYFTL
jgi:hypothetical protein